MGDDVEKEEKLFDTSPDSAMNSTLDWSSVRFAPISQTQNSDEDLLVADFANQPPVTNTVFPELAKLTTLERIPDAARVLQYR